MPKSQYKCTIVWCVLVIATVLSITYTRLYPTGDYSIIFIPTGNGSSSESEASTDGIRFVEGTQAIFKNAEQPLFIRYLNGSLDKKYKVKFPYGLLPKPPQVLYGNAPEDTLVEADLNSTDRVKLKKIIYWNDSYGQKHFDLGYGRRPFLIGNCRYHNCFTTSQRDRFTPNEIDAILWHFRSSDQSLPEVRYPNAHYIFFMAESASNLFGNLETFKDVFDLTFTYRRDSDIPDPYNVLAQREYSEDFYITNDFSVGKTKMAAWFVSNCFVVPSGRDLLAQRLMNYTEVDIYGKCGTLECPTSNSSSCYEMAAKKYFFYLSFENSLCKDYITEKFFNALNYDFVPVVYGSGPYWKHAPPHSYIDALDFPSVEDLAKYLIHLSRTPYEYNEFFRWKANYFVLPSYTRRIFSLCKICEILNTQKPSSNSRYDLQEWFAEQSDCKDKNSPFISDFLGGKKLNTSYNQYRCKDKPKNCYGPM